MAEDILEFNPDLLIVSTGCSFKREIEDMAKILIRAKKYALLHCIYISNPFKRSSFGKIAIFEKLGQISRIIRSQ